MDNIINSFRFPVNPQNSSFGNLLLWFDASNISTIKSGTSGTGPAPASGGTVGSLINKGSISFYVSQPTVNDRPKYYPNQENGLSVIRFDGVNDSLNLYGPGTSTVVGRLIDGNTDAVTYYSVQRGISRDEIQYVWHTRFRSPPRREGCGIQCVSNNTLRSFASRLTDYSSPINHSPSTIGGMKVVTVYVDYSITGTGIGNTNAIPLPESRRSYMQNGPGMSESVTSEFYLGSRTRTGNFFGGDFCELLLYRGILHTTQQSRQIEEYLFNKWRVIV